MRLHRAIWIGVMASVLIAPWSLGRAQPAPDNYAICRLVSLQWLPNSSDDLDRVLGVRTLRLGYRLDHPAHSVSLEFERHRADNPPFSYGISTFGPANPTGGAPDTALSGEIVIHIIDPEVFQPKDLADGMFRITVDVNDGLHESDWGERARNYARTRRDIALDDFDYQRHRVFTHYSAPPRGPSDKLVVYFFRPDDPKTWAADEEIAKGSLVLNVRFRP